jgi:dipeptidase
MLGCISRNHAIVKGEPMPCTTLLVGKRASYDGSTIVARNEDSEAGQFNPKCLRVIEPVDQPRHYRSVLSHLELDLPSDPMRYTSLPDASTARGVWGEAGINTCDVSMSATETLTTNERVLGADPLVELVCATGTPGEASWQPERVGGLGEEDLLTVVLPYIHSAREGVARLGSLLEEYGTYESNGIAFSDVDEVWWLETVGGHHWIARRVPDDCYVTAPNQLGIDSFDLTDAMGEATDHLCSPDLVEFVEKNHLDLGLGDPRVDGHRILDARAAFGSASDADHVYNTPRAWAMQRFLNPHAEPWDVPDQGLDPDSDDIPWCRVPERKVTIEDVRYTLALHYQGTPYDPFGRDGDEVTRHLLRPIGINRNGQLSVAQVRPDAPAACRSVQWVAYGCNVFNALVPLYANVDRAPAYLASTPATPTTASHYWTNRIIAALASPHFHDCEAHVERYQQRVGSQGHAILNRTDAAMAEADLAYADASEALAAANDEASHMLEDETNDLLAHVLYESSCDMGNAFSRSDM